jgi:hypothetical protein
MFIKLTKEDGSPISLNINHIVGFEMIEDRGENYSQDRVVSTLIKSYFVRESYSDIEKRVNDAQSK